MTGPKLAASVLGSDFARLAEQLQELEAAGADWVHFDVMDGRFVPPISMGAGICAAVRRCTRLPLDVHLMVVEPERQIRSFADAGATGLTVHWEAAPHIHRVLEEIRTAGLSAGVAINPGTPASVLSEVLDAVDLILVMSVDPGWGGQRYLAASTRKLQQVRTMLRERALHTVEVQVDGGIDRDTAGEATRAGASVLVAGSAIFNQRGSIAENVAAVRHATGFA